MDGMTTETTTPEVTQAQTAAGTTLDQQNTETTPEKMTALQKFINGLFGGSKDETDTAGAKQEETKAEESKGFTQADVEAAIKAAKEKWQEEAAEEERVKKLTPEERAAEEQKQKDARITELEGQLLRKELREDAVKALEKEGFPVGLADTLDYSSKERMEETLKNTTEIFKESLAVAIKERLKGKTPEGLGRAASNENLLRDQIAKSVRGM